MPEFRYNNIGVLCNRIEKMCPKLSIQWPDFGAVGNHLIIDNASAGNYRGNATCLNVYADLLLHKR